MKHIIIASSVLLCAGAIYGFIDYRLQSNTGRLNQLYKDEEYNSKATEKDGSAITSKKEEVKLMSHTNEKATATKQSEEAVVTNDHVTDKIKQKTKPVVKVIKSIEPVIEEDYEKVFTKVELSPLKGDAKIVYLASSADSIEYRKKEEKQIKAAMFSRAPIRKKQAAVIVVSAGSTSSFQ